MEGRTNMEENVAKFSEKLKELLAMAKKMRVTLDLSVYAENERAVAFYQKNVFRITGERIEEVTGRTELLMAFP